MIGGYSWGGQDTELCVRVNTEKYKILVLVKQRSEQGSFTVASLMGRVLKAIAYQSVVTFKAGEVSTR